MDNIQELLSRLADETDPKEKWSLLQSAGDSDDPGIQSARLWWNARYRMAGKKKNRVEDQFVWLFLYLSSMSRRQVKKSQMEEAYSQAMESPQLAEAVNRFPEAFYPQLLDTALLYVDTLREGRSVFGLMAIKDNGRDGLNKRVSGEIVLQLFEPLGQVCRDRPHAGLLVRAIRDAAVQLYPGIGTFLHDGVAGIKDDEARAFVQRGLLPQE